MQKKSKLRLQIEAQEATIRRLELHGDFPEAKKERQVLSGLYVRAGRNPDGTERGFGDFVHNGLHVDVTTPDSYKP